MELKISKKSKFLQNLHISGYSHQSAFDFSALSQELFAADVERAKKKNIEKHPIIGQERILLSLIRATYNMKNNRKYQRNKARLQEV